MLTSEKVSTSKLSGRKLENIHYLIYQKTIKKVTHDILYCCAKAKDVEMQSNSQIKIQHIHILWKRYVTRPIIISCYNFFYMFSFFITGEMSLSKV